MDKSVKINIERNPKWVEELEENKADIAMGGYISPRKLIIAGYIGKFVLQNIYYTILDDYNYF